MGECGKVGKKVIDFRRLLETKIDPNREIKLKETDFFNQMLKTKILLSVYGIELTSSETVCLVTVTVGRQTFCSSMKTTEMPTNWFREMIQFGKFGVEMSMDAVPSALLEDTEAPDLDAIQGNEAIPMSDFVKLQNISSKDGRIRLAEIFQHATDLGLFE
jgi:hypothetical protein